MLRPGEQRGLLQLVLEVNGRQLLFMNTHLDYRPNDAERLLNVEEIKRVTKQYGDLPMIVCGDFNDTPGSRVHQKMTEVFMDCWERAGQGDGFSYSSDKPRKRIDYVFVSSEALLIPLKAWAPHSDASDHLPLVVEMRMK
jgi:endonuclease/exonuclease/phosphatase family metal-dependent hydrolase